MDTLELVEPERWLEGEARRLPHAPAACRGAACPMFALCEGRCADKRQARALRSRNGGTSAASAVVDF